MATGGSGDKPLDLTIPKTSPSNKSDCSPSTSIISDHQQETSPSPGKHPATWLCEFCSNSYTKVSNLRRHQRLCHAEKLAALASIPCPSCSQRFFDEVGLRIHIAQTHQSKQKTPTPLDDDATIETTSTSPTSTGKPRYKCRYCEKTFVYSMAVREHERLRHRAEMEIVLDPETYCQGCSTQFPTIKSLQSHLDQSELCEAAIEHRRDKKKTS